MTQNFKIIHTCWMSGDPLPALQQKCIDSWRTFLPDYEIKIWNSDNWDVNRFVFAKEAFQHKQWAFVSDVVRLDILYEHGGIYLDFDVEVKKSFNPLLKHEFFTGHEIEWGGSVCTPYIMGAHPKNKLVKELLDFYEGRRFVRKDNTFERAPNTRYINSTLRKYGCVNDKNLCQEFIPGHVKYPSEIIGYDSPKSYAVHHFESAWLKLPDRHNQIEEIFEDIYKNNTWGNDSGPGSDPEYTKIYRQFLQQYLIINKVRSVIDLGCGDWQFSKLIDWEGIAYTGIDITYTCISKNEELYTRSNIAFIKSNIITDDIPDADLIIIKDVFQHLSFSSIEPVIEKLRNKSRVLIVQDDLALQHNLDCVDGDHRFLNMKAIPFNLSGNIIFKFGMSKTVLEWLPSKDINIGPERIYDFIATVYPCFALKRYGQPHDGGYVVPDLSYSKCITIGVANDVGFELDLGSQHACNFFLYDHTITQTPPLPNSEFHRIGLGTPSSNLFTLDEIIKRTKIIDSDTTLLKIDCEGGEWAGNLHTTDLATIDAIVIELHDLDRVSMYPIYIQVFDNLERDFFCINSHPNNYGGKFDFKGNAFPKVIEMSFISKKIYEKQIRDACKTLNFPNNPNEDDITFGMEFKE